MTLPSMRKVEQIHFVGIGGAGMCGIAEVLHNQGYRITGSDLVENRAIQRLHTLGIPVYLGDHNAEHIAGADLLVKSTAVSESNPEIQAALHHRIPVMPRAAMLAELMRRFQDSVAVAGTHGKTTTTSLISSILSEGGLDPSFVIGGKLNRCDTNAQLGKSSYFVAEADESDASFLYLKPLMAVVTNIDADHMETYGGSFEKLRSTFIEFLRHLPFYGLAVVCIEDEEVQKIVDEIQRPTRTYGFAETADYQALDWVQQGLVSSFICKRPKPHADLAITFRWPGKHNVLNALAAIAISTELGVPDDVIVNGLLYFQGVGRRFQMLGEQVFSQGSAIVIDDYGHHPREIYATIDTFRRVWPTKRLIHVFQPHRYSRTQALFDQFVDVLRLGDLVLLLDIYPAGESPIAGIDTAALIEQIKRQQPKIQLVSEATLRQTLNACVENGDVILMQGAGSVGQMALNLMQPAKESA